MSWRQRGPSQKYPVVINFHDGGFTPDDACDDARWAAAIVSQIGAIVVSVDYRLAVTYYRLRSRGSCKNRTFKLISIGVPRFTHFDILVYKQGQYPSHNNGKLCTGFIVSLLFAKSF